MTKYLGLSLIIISFIGTLFFKHYSGEIISYPFLWYIAFAVLGLTGAALIFSSMSNEKAAANESYQQAVEKAKATAQKTELDFDKCEFKNGSYSREIEDPELSTLKHIVPHNLSIYMDTTKRQHSHNHILSTRKLAWANNGDI